MIFGLIEDTLVATPCMQTKVWSDSEFSVRGVLGAEEIGPSIATLTLTSDVTNRMMRFNQ